MMNFSAQQIASLVNGTVEGDPEITVSAPSGIENAVAGQISFLSNSKYDHYIYSTEASIVLISHSFELTKEVKSTLIRVENVYTAVAELMQRFSIQPVHHFISESAFIDKESNLSDNITIGHYSIVNKGVSIGEGSVIEGQVYLGENVTIGKNVRINPGVKIYKGCHIGDNCIIHANAVIGSDGFGFAPDETGKYKKIPQLGNVIVENDVEIGSNTVIDRGSMGSTIIKTGTKLDNLIQIAHNVTVGQHTVIAAQTGISGSTKIGDRCMIGGQVGIVGHIEIGDQTKIQAQSGVTKGSEEGAKLYGSPAIEYGNYIRSYGQFKNLPDLVKEIRILKKEIEALKESK